MLRTNLAITVLAYLMMGFFALMLCIKTFDPLSNALMSFSFTDIYYQILSQTAVPDTSHVVTIVDMTKLYRRGDIAQLLEEIEKGRPRVVGVDVVFDVEKDDFEGNDSLIHVAQTYDNMVFSVKFLEFDEKQNQYTKEIHSFFTQYVDVEEGFCNVPRSGQYDATKRTLLRRVRSLGKDHPSLAVKVVQDYIGRPVDSDGEDQLMVNFSPKKFHVLTPEEVREHPELIEDRIVMVGAMYEDTDYHWTPAGRIPGVELLAYGIQTMLEKKEVIQLPSFLTYLLSFAISLLYCYFSSSYKRVTANSSNMFVRFVIGSSYVLSVITFLFTSIVVFITFLVFAITDITINLAWAISSMAFMGTSTNMYKALRDYVRNRNMQMQTITKE